MRWKMKKIYFEPQLDIFLFYEDVITASDLENDDDFDDSNW